MPRNVIVKCAICACVEGNFAIMLLKECIIYVNKPILPALFAIIKLLLQ